MFFNLIRRLFCLEEKKRYFFTNKFNYLYNRKNKVIFFLNEKLEPVISLTGFNYKIAEGENLCDEKDRIDYYLDMFHLYLVDEKYGEYNLKTAEFTLKDKSEFCLICEQEKKNTEIVFNSNKTTNELQEAKEYNLYGLGSNVMCELGFDQDDVFITSEPVQLTHIKRNIKKVITSLIHTVIIYDDGAVVSFGVNDEGALGRPEKTPEDRPVEVVVPTHDDEYIVDGAATDNSTVLISNLGFVFITGNFRSSKQQLGGYSLQKYEFKKIHEFNQIVKVVGGKNHFVFLTSNKQVFTMGNNEFGQLGFKNSDYPHCVNQACKYEVPVSRVYGDTPVDIFVSMNATYIKTIKGVLAFGRNTTNNISSRNIKLIEEPVYLSNPIFNKFSKIQGGDGTMFLLSEGKLYGRGNNQLHQIDGSSDVMINKPILIGENINDFSVLANSVTMIIDGQVYCKGSNTRGELGHNENDMPYLKKVTKIPYDFTKNGSEKVVGVYSGNEYMIAQTELVK